MAGLIEISCLVSRSLAWKFPFCHLVFRKWI